MNIISLGAGVQSSTMALMAAHGEITPMPDAAIFADTQAEPKAVYEWLDWLEKQLPFPVYRVTAGSLADAIGKQRPFGKWKMMPIPAFIAGKDGKGAPANRSCTRDFKIDPIVKQVRALCGLTRKRAPKAPIVSQWIGISTDEAGRMKPSRQAWIEHRWPLIEAGMSREGCLKWMKAHGYPMPGKSSCVFCPYHSDAEWQRTKANPSEWAQAVEIDKRVRDLWRGRVPSGIYLHHSLMPLDQVDFSTDEDRGQLNMFNNECEGMCGV